MSNKLDSCKECGIPFVFERESEHAICFQCASFEESLSKTKLRRDLDAAMETISSLSRDLYELKTVVDSLRSNSPFGDRVW